MKYASVLLFNILGLAASNVAIGADDALKVAAVSRVEHANKEPGNWLSYGRTYDEQRYSPLDNINTKNISQLGLSWSYDFLNSRGKEATPLVIDGVMYVTGSWSTVYAFDAKTGASLWFFDPAVPREIAGILCCDVINRGVAYSSGRLFLGTLDGRLLALDAKTGKQIWSVQTTPKAKAYSISGAPRVVNNKVIIGNGGSEFGGVRGFVSAYAENDGRLVWRFYTVPGNPDLPFESPAMAMAAKTWSGDWWKSGGGGTAWDAMAFDPKHNLLYIGVGNGAPWSHYLRSQGKGDNLFLSSIVALRPDTGEYVWHYQTTPKDSWDYTATQHIILADMEIGGQQREVLMQAPKNGFFYVLDRVTGELLSADKYTTVTWASHVDLKTGRPVENPDVHYGADAAQVIFPGSLGGHNWQPMSYSPKTGLVYVPIHHIAGVYRQDKKFEQSKSYWKTGTDWLELALPDDAEIIKQALASIRGQLIAWDPLRQKIAWSVEQLNVWNGGLLSTAGGLVFQGDAEGMLSAYRDADGEKLWAFNALGGMIAPPVTYTVDGEQYIAILAGWGGAYPATAGLAGTRSKGALQRSRLLVFKLGAQGVLKPESSLPDRHVDSAVLAYKVDAGLVEKGKSLYMNNCFFCHGEGVVSATPIPDLRYLSAQKHDIFKLIVLQGAFKTLGMPSFEGRLTAAESDAIQAFIVQKTQADFGAAVIGN